MPEKKNGAGAERRHFFSRRSVAAQNKASAAAEPAASAGEEKAAAPAAKRLRNPFQRAERRDAQKAEQPKPKAEAVRPKAEQPKHKTEQPRSKAEQTRPKAEQPKPKAEQTRPKAEQPKPKAEQPKPKAEQAKPKAEQAKPKAEAVRPKAEQPSGKKPPQAAEKKPERKGEKRAGEIPGAPLRIIPLGGLGEIGKNMTLIEYEDDIVIIDCGLAFPDDDMFGVDLVIPDFTYVLRNRDRVRGVVVTHGHEDHIGSLSYLLREINVPVYSARLTIGLIEGKLKEAGLLRDAKLHVVKAGDRVKLGRIAVEFIAVNHSIPDSYGLAIFTPVGTLVHTGDFKIDYTPVDGQMINLARFGELGSQGVLALMSDSTNAERPGITPSERRVGRTFNMLFDRAGDRRIIVASFSSNIHRLQQLIETAERYGRRVVISGRSMENVTAKAIELGYLKAAEGTIIPIDEMRRYPDEQLVIATTGSQGEPMSALTRMAHGEHRKITVTEHDFVIISATPIPGNEKLVGRVINDLMHLGADVIYENTAGIHVSGHGCQEEIKTIIGLTKPRYFIPVHGEFKHLAKNRSLAIEMGIPRENILVGENGYVIEILPQGGLRCNTTVPAGAVLVDGSGVGDVGSIVLRDRRMLADEGLVVAVASVDEKTGELLAGPDLITRGFVYVRESEELLAEAQQQCRAAIAQAMKGSRRDWGAIKQAVKDQLGAFIFQKTRRRPVILPVIQEIKTKR